MKRVLAGFALAVWFGAAALAGEWQGHLMDAMCAAKMKDKAAGHKAKCALSCAKSGFGLVTADGKFMKFDESGNAKAQEALKATSKEQDLMVKVTGTLDGDAIQVESLRIH
jgi:hypothetical protein